MVMWVEFEIVGLDVLDCFLEWYCFVGSSFVIIFFVDCGWFVFFKRVVVW